ncbi:MAG: ABC transporter ATP-binding protein [candidate division Zixibacteria bacterium]|nr:ABC transporter ATP-binding protein [candidate division Zixibacteria bacterium]
MISLKNVEKVYRTEEIETLALSGINLEIEEGEFVSVMGPSGSGKSTLFNVIGLLDEPSKGSVLLAGESIQGLPDREQARIRNRQVGFIFQTFHLISDLDVIDNVEIPLLYRHLSSSERRSRALRALERVGLASRVRHFPSQLSGGQQQRVAIARAIVGQPRILLADEPTGNLDSQMGEEIMKILMGLNEDEKATIVMVTHDARLAEKTERIVRLFDGRQVN